MPQDHERFMRVALEEAAKGGAEGNVAVGSVVVRDGTLVAGGRNLVTSAHDPTAHAEVVALRNASAARGTEDLSGCDLYTTFEPCPMCCGAIIVSGIETLVMGARPGPGENRWGGYTVESLIKLTKWDDRVKVVTGVLPEECARIRDEWEARNKR